MENFENIINDSCGKTDAFSEAIQHFSSDDPMDISAESIECALATPAIPQQSFTACNFVSDMNRLMHRSSAFVPKQSDSAISVLSVAPAKYSEIPPMQVIRKLQERGPFWIRSYRGELYLYDGWTYVKRGDSEITSMILDALRPYWSTHRDPKSAISKVIQLLKADPQFKISDNYRDDPNLVPFLNGVYDLTTGRLLPPSPTVFFTYYVQANFDESMACPAFERFCETSFEGDPLKRLALLQMIGSLLTSDMTGKVFWVLQGVPNSGKSVVGRLIRSFFSPDKVASMEINRLGDKFAGYALMGKLVNVFMDLVDGKIPPKAVSLLKSITGGEDITAEGKGKDSIRYTPYVKFVFGTNFIIACLRNDPALLNRIILIPFGVSIPLELQDPELDQKLFAELPGISAMAMEALRELRQNGYNYIRFPQIAPEKLCVASAPDALVSFVTEQCEFVEDAYTHTDALYWAYVGFCQEKSLLCTTDKTQFSKKLLNYFGDRLGERLKKQHAWGYMGIRLKEIWIGRIDEPNPEPVPPPHEI